MPIEAIHNVLSERCSVPSCHGYEGVSGFTGKDYEAREHSTGASAAPVNVNLVLRPGGGLRPRVNHVDQMIPIPSAACRATASTRTEYSTMLLLGQKLSSALTYSYTSSDGLRDEIGGAGFAGARRLLCILTNLGTIIHLPDRP